MSAEVNHDGFKWVSAGLPYPAWELRFKDDKRDDEYVTAARVEKEVMSGPLGGEAVKWLLVMYPMEGQSRKPIASAVTPYDTRKEAMAQAEQRLRERTESMTDQRRALVVAIVEIKDRAGRLAMWKTMHALEDVERQVGWELAELLGAPEPQTARRRMRDHAR